jgi:hypothetical protein
MSSLRAVTLIAATMTTGLMAGVFGFSPPVRRGALVSLEPGRTITTTVAFGSLCWALVNTGD